MRINHNINKFSFHRQKTTRIIFGVQILRDYNIDNEDYIRNHFVEVENMFTNPNGNPIHKLALLKTAKQMTSIISIKVSLEREKKRFIGRSGGDHFYCGNLHNEYNNSKCRY